ncbi:AHH domain-containing protein [Niveibacterium microcysteis]|uniref:AHH domain-containing protein n=1 Tax=Niveibacterium microcysteis TaxID=2811415 RepID=A0ABX7M759_9RHOO|nr:AHH domain-containing protein [Niveibacterium microcysteis]QSI77587.1 AHH domain-containing protein [Niveibacterium microcysteis]
MTQIGEGVAVGLVLDEPGDKKCIFCGEDHQKKEQEPLPPETFTRNDDALTQAGRSYIKGDADRSCYYPKDASGAWVSPLEPPAWDDQTIFKTYLKGGKTSARAEKYQPPPIKGWIAAPHHMVAVCCMNGTNKLPRKPKVNPWAKKGAYDINGGGNCIFLPSSASQFFAAYYLARSRGTGRPLQGHLGAHRKIYFETVWAMLERTVRLLKAEGFCDKTEEPADKDAIARAVVEEMHVTEATLFRKLAARQPEDAFRLGAESYIEIPPDDVDINVARAQIAPFLQGAYETLPEWY